MRSSGIFFSLIGLIGLIRLIRPIGLIRLIRLIGLIRPIRSHKAGGLWLLISNSFQSSRVGARDDVGAPGRGFVGRREIIPNAQLKTLGLVAFCGGGRFALQYGPYCNAKRPILHCKTACIAGRNGGWRNALAASRLAKRRVLTVLS